MTAGGVAISSVKSLELLAGVVKILWQTQLHFWSAHLQFQNQTKIVERDNLSFRHRHYQQSVRTLCSKRDLCLPAHRDQYFPADIEAFLSQSTTTQLRQYLHHYESAITKSIQLAAQQPIRPLTSFPGFFRHPSRPPQVPAPTNISATNLPSAFQASVSRRFSNLLGARGAPTHHKHTRWRTPSLWEFFPSRPAPD